MVVIMWNFKVKSWPCSCPAGAATVEPVWGLGYEKTDHSYNIRRRDRPLHHYSCCQHHSLLTLATTGGGVEIGDLVSTWMSRSLQWSLMENLGPSLAFPTISACFCIQRQLLFGRNLFPNKTYRGARCYDIWEVTNGPGNTPVRLASAGAASMLGNSTAFWNLILIALS